MADVRGDLTRLYLAFKRARILCLAVIGTNGGLTGLAIPDNAPSSTVADVLSECLDAFEMEFNDGSRLVAAEELITGHSRTWMIADGFDEGRSLPFPSRLAFRLKGDPDAVALRVISQAKDVLQRSCDDVAVASTQQFLLNLISGAYKETSRTRRYLPALQLHAACMIADAIFPYDFMPADNPILQMRCLPIAITCRETERDYATPPIERVSFALGGLVRRTANTMDPDIAVGLLRQLFVEGAQHTLPLPLSPFAGDMTLWRFDANDCDRIVVGSNHMNLQGFSLDFTTIDIVRGKQTRGTQLGGPTDLGF